MKELLVIGPGDSFAVLGIVQNIKLKIISNMVCGSKDVSSLLVARGVKTRLILLIQRYAGLGFLR